MNEINEFSQTFKAIYLIDLSPSLCEVAQERVVKNGWQHVQIICADACDFEFPYDQVDLITFSYSLSMIPAYYSAIDHAEKLLSKSHGVICSVDFEVQSDVNTIGRTNTLGGLINRNVPWLFRTFWRIWFECDKLGVDKSYDTQLVHRINDLATESPYLAPMTTNSTNKANSKALEAAIQNTKKNLPYPSLFYQKEIWRVYFEEISDQYEQFRNQYIYAFTWEDPVEDAKILKLNTNDTLLCITSAGDNLLSYASLPEPPKRIHGVDLNPCQGHLAELKLASLRCLEFEEIWKLFGEGKVKNFEKLLTNKLSPHLSSNAFQYWFTKGSQTFDPNGKGLYDTGSTRWAIRLARYVFKITSTSSKVIELCDAKTMTEQKGIWESLIRPALFNFAVGKLFVGNPIFLWKALGVPANQAAMMDTSILQYFIDTLDPIVGRNLISSDNYFYFLALKSFYKKGNCPEYISKHGFKVLSRKNNSPLDNIRLHTDTLNNVFERLTKKTISVAVIMDHMDWFDQKDDDVNDEVNALFVALIINGRVLLRSAAKYPWYIKNFEVKGFQCKPVSIRESGTSINRVSMYASTWICTKKIDDKLESLDFDA